MRNTTHAYSLRPNAKGRRGRQSTGDPDGQVEGSSASNSTSTSACSTGDGHGFTDESGSNDQGLAALDMPDAVHNIPGHAQDSGRQQRTQGDQQQSHVLTASSAVRNVTYHHRTDMGGCTTRQLTKSWEEIQAGRQREEARRCAEAVRIRREQIVRGFEQEIRGLRARIVALRDECEEQVAWEQRKWEQAREIERGKVAMVEPEEDGEMMVDLGSEDADFEMEDRKDYSPMQVSMTAESDNDNEQWQQQWWPSQPPPHRSRRSEPHFSAPLQTGSWELQQQPPRMGEISASSGMAALESPSQMQPQAMKEEREEARRRPRRSQGRVIQGQPLQRQSAQLVVIPVLDSEKRDRDSEMVIKPVN